MKWIEIDNHLCAGIQLKDFSTAFACMTEIAFAIEKMDHHPEWTNIYNAIHFRLNTHTAGDKVTAKDHKLAELITSICHKYGPKNIE